MSDHKFKELVREVSLGVKGCIGRGYVQKYYEDIALEILARVYDVCEDHILPEPDGLPPVFDSE